MKLAKPLIHIRDRQCLISSPTDAVKVLALVMKGVESTGGGAAFGKCLLHETVVSP